jgi:hypothetical protein
LKTSYASSDVLYLPINLFWQPFLQEIILKVKGGNFFLPGFFKITIFFARLFFFGPGFLGLPTFLFFLFSAFFLRSFSFFRRSFSFFLASSFFFFAFFLLLPFYHSY